MTEPRRRTLVEQADLEACVARSKAALNDPVRRQRFEEATESAARHVAEDLARQDARSPRDAALASLGPNATEEQIGEWISKYRPNG